MIFDGLLNQLCTVAGESYRVRFADVLSEYDIKLVKVGSSDLVYHIGQYIVDSRVNGLAARTLQNYEYNLHRFAACVQKPISDIDTADIRGYIRHLSDNRPLAVSSIQMHINILRAFFGWAVTEGVVQHNPMAKIKSLKIDKRSLRDALTQEELERVRDACQTYREKALIEFFVSSGCRLGEVTGLMVDDLNLHERCTVVLGKGHKLRTVYFSVRAKMLIETYLRERKGGDALFSSMKMPFSPLKDTAIRRIVKMVGKRAGLRRNLYPHLLRHTFATNAINAGMRLVVVQHLLGHDNPNTTQIYAALADEEIHHEYNKIMIGK